MKHLKHFSLLGAVMALLPLLIITINAAADVLVPVGSVWKYLDNGSNEGTAWRAPSFNDSTWASGPAQLGYGDGDEATVVSYGPSSTDKYITTYFRGSFNVADPSIYASLTLSLLRDDGAVVYLNGKEVFRNNMPAGTISYTTIASTAIGAPQESTFYQTTVAVTNLVAGINVLGVEIHQANLTSTDISFDLELSASTTPTVPRGPYLQMGTPTSAVVRWRTDISTDSGVRYGTDPANLSSAADDLTVTNEHVVTVSGLTPDTKYYYSIGTTGGLSVSDTNFFFVTSPGVGTPKATRVWVLGDSGTADANAGNVRSAYYSFTGSRATDLLLMLGDNAYDTGTDAEYQTAVFNMYPNTLENTFLWPTLGNHDTAQSTTFNDSYPYFSIFTLPKNGEAGGLASGTEHYYSFDYGNIHFICLDSMTADRATTGAMANWLRSDLAATAQEWLIAFWHHPPYTKGSHNSDTEGQLIEMRQNFLPILEAAGVDVVLTGHSHSYERSYLLNGQYGPSGTLTQEMKVDGGDGREDGTGAYHKPEGLAANAGAVYAVAGSSGKISGGSLNHPAMYISLNVLGSMVLDINSNRLDAVFLNTNGVAEDHFTISKAAAMATPPAAPAGLTATAVSTTEIDLAWTQNSTNENGFTVERSTDGVNFTPIATVGANVVNGADIGLNPSTTYYYRVRAFNAAGDSAYSNITSARTFDVPPPAPTGLTALAGNAQVSLTWNTSVGATSYNVKRSNTSGGPYTTIATGVTPTSYTDTTVANGTTYYYVVSASNSAGESPNSNETSATTQPPPPPAAPAGIIAVAGDRTVTLTWDQSPGATHYYVYRAEVSGEPYNLVAYGIYTPMWTDTGVTPHTTYFYVVKAVNDGGTSPYSTEASATPYALPIAPTGAAITFADFTALELGWEDNATDETGYTIERSVDNLSFTLLASLPAATTFYRDEGLADNTTYFYRVRAFNNDGQSAPAEVSGTTEALPPNPPGNLAAMIVSSSQIDLAWFDNGDNETAFEIERAIGAAGTWSVLASVAANSTSYSDTSLTPGTTYHYRVRALNTGGYSGNSNEADATTPFPTTTITLTSVAAQDGYVLESSETSNVGGSATANTSGNSGLRAGDDNKKRQFKAIVSFGTSSIPDGAIIVSATLRLKRGTVSGTNPFQTHGNCLVDIKAASGFNNATALTKEDFQAPTDVAQVATLSNAAANGQWSEGALNAPGLLIINKTGTTQCRIYFATDDNNNGTSDYIGWYAGDNATAANRPQLIVVYQ